MPMRLVKVTSKWLAIRIAVADMLSFLSKRSKGDTLVEVMVAVTIFSLVAVGAVSIMNRGAETAQRSLEITLSKQEIDAQAEAIRFLNASFIASYVRGADDSYYTGQAATWVNIPKVAMPSDFGITNSGDCPDRPSDSFVINTHTMTVQKLGTKMAPIKGPSVSPTYSKINYNSTLTSNIDSVDGLWVEAVDGGTIDNAGYVDFNIRACWDSFGSSVPVTLGTIVRLYEPR